jgi:hypothetical protein
VHEKIVSESLGPKFDYYVSSNAPVGFHWHVPDAETQKKTGFYGDKVRAATSALTRTHT